MWAGEGQRERETQNPKQTPGSELPEQGPMQGSNSQTVRSWPELKSEAYPTEPLRHPLFPHLDLRNKFIFLWKPASHLHSLSILSQLDSKLPEWNNLRSLVHHCIFIDYFGSRSWTWTLRAECTQLHSKHICWMSIIYSVIKACKSCRHVLFTCFFISPYVILRFYCSFVLLILVIYLLCTTQLSFLLPVSRSTTFPIGVPLSNFFLS